VGGLDGPGPAGGRRDVKPMEQLLPHAEGYQMGERDAPPAVPDDGLVAPPVGGDVENLVDGVLQEPGQRGRIRFGDVGDAGRVLGCERVPGEPGNRRRHAGGDVGAQGRSGQEVNTGFPDGPVGPGYADVEVW